MKLNVEKEVAALRRMTLNEPRDRFAEVFGEPTTTRNKIWLVRRIAWRLQAKAEGGLSERALKRAAQLADEADEADLRGYHLGSRPSRPTRSSPFPAHPILGSRRPRTVLTRQYKGGRSGRWCWRTGSYTRKRSTRRSPQSPERSPAPTRTDTCSSA